MSSDAETFEFHSPRSLMAQANTLPKAKDREIFWENPEDDELVEIDGHKAVYNPANNQIYNTVTDEYEVINPPQFVGPLVTQIKERNLQSIQGKFNVYQDGAQGYGEVLFDNHEIYPPDRNRSDDPVRTGLTLRYSHDGGMSVSAEGFAQDGMCTNTMRRVTDAVYVKHSGDVKSRTDWQEEWDGVLSQLGAFSEALAQIIEQAMEFHMFDLDEYEFSSEWLDATNPQSSIEEIASPVGVDDEHIRGMHGFYEYIGFPRYLALESVGRLMFRLRRAQRTTDVTAWHVYSSATYALSHEARFNAGSSSDNKYHRIASDILNNPAKSIQDARQGLQSILHEDEQDYDIEETVGEALATYEEREQIIRDSLKV